MKILRAAHLGMCFGVRDALALARHEARSHPITILGDLVHNPTVLGALQAQGVQTVQEVQQVRTAHVLITAHGVSDRRLASLRTRGLTVREATCPLVRLAHRAVVALAREGYHPLIIGRRDHVEVRGLTEDLPAFDVVGEEREVARLAERARWGVVAQTTQPIQRVRRLVEALRARFPEAEVKFVDTVCQPTKLRQNAAMVLAVHCDAVVVIGGEQSNNTRELVATCRQHGARVHHIQRAADLRPEWFAGAGTVGLTAGTSTPDAVIAEVEVKLRAWAAEWEAPETPVVDRAWVSQVRWADAPCGAAETQGHAAETAIAAESSSFVPEHAAECKEVLAHV
jgi:4-hydroxy-3-methylbut-2-enyl diphosphate reductase